MERRGNEGRRSRVNEQKQNCALNKWLYLLLFQTYSKGWNSPVLTIFSARKLLSAQFCAFATCANSKEEKYIYYTGYGENNVLEQTVVGQTNFYSDYITVETWSFIR